MIGLSGIGYVVYGSHRLKPPRMVVGFRETGQHGLPSRADSSQPPAEAVFFSGGSRLVSGAAAWKDTRHASSAESDRSLQRFGGRLTGNLVEASYSRHAVAKSISSASRYQSLPAPLTDLFSRTPGDTKGLHGPRGRKQQQAHGLYIVGWRFNPGAFGSRLVYRCHRKTGPMCGGGFDGIWNRQGMHPVQAETQVTCRITREGSRFVQCHIPSKPLARIG